MSTATKVQRYVWLLAAIGALGLFFYASWVNYIAHRNEESVKTVTANTEQITRHLHSAASDAQTFRDLLSSAIAMADTENLTKANRIGEAVSTSLGRAIIAEYDKPHTQELERLQSEFSDLYPQLIKMASQIIEDPDRAFDMAESLNRINTRYDAWLAGIRQTTHDHLNEDAQALKHISRDMKNARLTGITAAVMSLVLIICVAAYLSKTAVRAILEGEELQAQVLMITAEKEAAQQESLANKEAALQTIRSYSQKLEEEVENRTEALQCALTQKADYLKKVETLLDNAGEGFLSFNDDLLIDDGYSRECCTIFNGETLFGNICNLLSPDNATQRNFLEKAFTAIMSTDPNSDMESTFISLLPTQMQLGEKHLLIKYRRTEPQRMMLVISDVTEHTALTDALERKHQELEFIVYALGNLDETKKIIEDFKVFLNGSTLAPEQTGVAASQSIKEVYRHVHTFKSLLAQACFPDLPAKLHALETALPLSSNLTPGFDEAQWQSLLETHGIRDALAHSEMLLQQHLGEFWHSESNNYLVPVSVLGSLEATLSQEVSQGSPALKQLRALQHRPLRSLLEPHFREAKRLASSQGKILDDLVFTGDNPAIDPNQFGVFLRTMVHLFKNAVDHGIESPVQRARSGKADAGTLQCRITTSAQALDIVLEDDGAGIDTKAIKAKAVDLGVISPGVAEAMNDQDACELVFHDGLSSCDTVTASAGRGVGLAALREAVVALGGNIAVTSRQGLGTRWHIQLPFSPA